MAPPSLRRPRLVRHVPAGLVLWLAVASVGSAARGQAAAPGLELFAPAPPPGLVDPWGADAAFDARGDRAPRPLLLHRHGSPLTPPSGASAEAVARGLLAALARPAGELVVTGVEETTPGVRHVAVEQRIGGTRVLGGRSWVAVLADGSVLSARVGEVAPAAPPPASPSPRLQSASAARAAALEALGLAASEPPSRGDSADRVLLATADGSVRAWRVVLVLTDAPEHAWELVMAEDDGRLVRRVARSFPAVKGAHVFPHDPTRPRAWAAFPDPVDSPSVDSPAGWASGLETVGNNVWAQLDREGDYTDTFGRTAVAVGDPPVLDFAFTGDPRQDADLALSNVFWALNDAHDRFRRLGLTEASGAMQQDSMGRGGREGDRVWALVQHASGDGSIPYEAVYMGVGADGGYTYVVAGVFETDGGELRDSSLETDLLYHEYAHGVSTRLVGDDPACLAGPQPQALSEGWSDFFAASFTDDPVIAAWTSDNAFSGQRQRPLDDNTFTLFNLCADGCNRLNDGEIWSGALWDLREDLRARFGAAAGTQRAERLVVEGMRHSPCRPTFVDARDGLLLADAALRGGADHCAIWSVLAARGLGWSAATTGPDDTRPLAAFDLPPQCSGGRTAWLDRDEYASDARLEVLTLDGGAAPPATARISSGAGDVETVALSLSPVGPVRRAFLDVRAAAVVPEDGVLQVAAADTITADVGGTVATARVSSAIPMTVLDHDVWGAWCQDPSSDDDHPAGWYVLPGFLDAGETVTLTVTLGHLAEGDLEGAAVTVTSTSRDVRVLPAGPIPLGTIPRRAGASPRAFTFDVRAEAAPTVTPGQVARLRFDVVARGRSGSVTLDLPLSLDYVVETGWSAFAGGVETFDGPTAARWTHVARRGPSDQWGIEPCAGELATTGARVGLAGCAPYADGQVAATLDSPPVVPLPPDAAALRFTDFSWRHVVDLWTDPANGYCDADMLALFLTADAAGLPYDNPFGVYDAGTQRAWFFPENTGGWAAGGPYYLNREPQLLQPGFPYDRLQLTWAFWGDVVDCGFETANAGAYNLDDVRLTYDVVRAVPEPTPCAIDCLLRVATVADPPGPKCDGEPFTIVASVEQLDCAGEVYLSFAGPGVPPSHGWTTETSSPAVGGDGATYATYAQCETNPACNAYTQWGNVSPARPGVGAPLPASLRVRREGDDLVLAWMGAAAPATYGVYRTLDRSDLPAGSAGWPLRLEVDGEGPRGEGQARDLGGALVPGPAFFQLLSRDPCTDAPRLP